MIKETKNTTRCGLKGAYLLSLLSETLPEWTIQIKNPRKNSNILRIIFEKEVEDYEEEAIFK